MKFYEYEAKSTFDKYGIAIPRGHVASSPEEAKWIAEEIKGPVAIKAQILAGGRGKAGGIKFASTPSEAATITEQLLGKTFKGFKVSKVLVEEKLDIEKEFYLGFTIDRSAKKMVAIISSLGGVDIEDVAKSNPECIVKKHVDPLTGFYPFHARIMLTKLGFKGKLLVALSNVMKTFYDIAIDYDAELVESNPFVLTKDGKLYAADGRLNVDSDSLFRHPSLKDKLLGHGLSKFEAEAKAAGISYVELDGNIGIIGNGAGLVMATLDMVNLYGGKPANFLDVGGGAREKAVTTSFKILMEHDNVKVIFVNILGGITRCDVVARGLIYALKIFGKIKPIVIRLTGTNEELGRKLLKEEGLMTFSSMEEATERAVKLSKEV